MGFMGFFPKVLKTPLEKGVLAEGFGFFGENLPIFGGFCLETLFVGKNLLFWVVNPLVSFSKN
jgi:hypothetical protein